MPYITRVLAERCRNVTHLDIDLTPVQGEARSFLHLILTGPNGSGKSGILDAIHKEIAAGWGEVEDPRDQYPAIIDATRKENARNPRKDLQSAIASHEQRLASIKSERPVQLRWDVRPLSNLLPPGSWFYTALWATRRLFLSKVEGPKAIDLNQAATRRDPLSSFLLQYLVNQKTAQAFASVDGDQIEAERLEKWLEQFRRWVAFITGDDAIRMEFDRTAFNFLFTLSDGYPFDLKQLSDGASSVLAILAELLLQQEEARRLRKDPAGELSGVVLIDEIEVHLHLKLQESILPFLTGLFPQVQFIVATHSPAVIASIPGAVVCDLGAKMQRRSEDFRGKNYGTLVVGHFGVASDLDLDTTAKLERYRQLSAKNQRSAEEEQERLNLRDLITDRSQSLAVDLWLADGEGEADDPI